MRFARIRLAAATALASALVVGGLVVTPTARAAITGSQITTPSDPSFFIADEDATAQTFAISGTTTGGAASAMVDVRCYYGGTSVRVAHDVALESNGSFSVAAADLNKLIQLTCRLRAVPADTNPKDVTPFTGPVVGVGERSTSKVTGGPNDGTAYDYYIDAQQPTGAFDYASLGSCGVHTGYLMDPSFALTTLTYSCNAGLISAPTRSEAQVDGASAYAPDQAFLIDSSAKGLPAMTYSYSLDQHSGKLVIHESDPLVECTAATYPPTSASCSSFVSTGVTDDRTITQDHDGHIGWITDAFKSTDGKAHSVDLLWDNSQQFWGPSGDSSQVEYEFPGQSSFSTHKAGDSVSLPSSPGAIFIRMHGAADGNPGTGEGAIVYDRPATAAAFTSVTSFYSKLTLHQTGAVPAGGSTQFRFAYVQDYQSADVASLAKAAGSSFLDKVALSKAGSGKGKVTSSPAGIACGRACAHGYAYGTAVTLKARPAKGSRFSGWSGGACKGVHACKVTLDGKVAIKARFILRPCVVPNLVGKTLKAARLAIKRAFCSVGRVVTAASANVKKGHVASQKPRRGKRVKQHSKIALVVS